MAEHTYRTTPDQTLTRMPGGVPFIIGNELAERFSFYGMKGILVIFMTTYLLGADGELATMNREEALTVYHNFTGSAYFFPIIGALLADVFLGKYRTILYLSLLYCVGHGCLAMMDIAPHTMGIGMKPWLFAGLACIAMGSGAIKPCVSAHVGDQFGKGNQNLLTQVFNWFYFSINIGAATSMILTPMFLEGFKIGENPETGEAITFGGPWLAFGTPGVLMAIATFVFWLGRNRFIHVPPGGIGFLKETFSADGRRAVFNLLPLFLIFVPIFWAIFDQTGSAWVLQSEQMNRNFVGHEWLPAQIQAVNPILILTGIPIFTYLIYPLMGKFFRVTPLRKVGIGFVLTAGAFAVSAMIETWIQAGSGPVIAELWAAMGQTGEAPTQLKDVVLRAKELGWTAEQLAPYMEPLPNVGWQFLAYIILTSGEIMVSIVCLEFAYTQSPKKMKSFIMGIYFLGVSLGNFYVAGVNFFMDQTRDEAGNTPLDGPNYYWFFAGLMMFAFLIYLVWTKTYKGRTYIQGVDEEIAEAQAEAQAPDAR